MLKTKFNWTVSYKSIYKKLVTIAMVIVNLSSLSAQYMNIHKEDKLIQSFSIQDIQRLSFFGNSMLIKKKGNINDEIFTIVEIKKIMFGQEEGGVTTGVKPEKNDDNVVIYPNPVNDFLVIESPFEILEVNIFDINGRNILNMNHMDKRTVVSFESYPKGLYIIKIITQQTIYTNKIIKN